MPLMTAKEARNRIDNMSDAVSVQLKEQVTKIIEAAIAKGEISVSLDIPYNHVDRFETWLTSLGYCVSSGTSYQGDWFKVSW